MFHLTVPFLKVWSLVPVWGRRVGGWGKGKQDVPSSLLSSQAGEQSLSWKQKAKQGHRKAHPDRQVLSLMPHELQGDRRKHTLGY